VQGVGIRLTFIGEQSMDEITKKNLKMCGIVWSGFLLWQFIITSIFHNMPTLAHSIGFAMGGTFGLIIIPCIVSILAKFISGKLFLEMMWKMSLYIIVPLNFILLINKFYRV
jgi:hypothetical protein